MLIEWNHFQWKRELKIIIRKWKRCIKSKGLYSKVWIFMVFNGGVEVEAKMWSVLFTRFKVYPNINLWSHIASSFKDLRGSVGWGAAPGIELRVRTPEIREAEVCYFYVHLLIEQEIFGFQVTMYDSPENINSNVKMLYRIEVREGSNEKYLK